MSLEAARSRQLANLYLSINLLKSPMLAKIIVRYRELFSFLLIGGGAAFSYAVLNYFALGHFDNLPKALVSALCYSVFVIPVYLLQRGFAFASKIEHRAAFPRYVLTQIVAIGANYLFAKLIFEFWHWPHFFGSVAAIIATSGA